MCLQPTRDAASLIPLGFVADTIQRGGIGSQIHVLGLAISTAMDLDRVLLLDTDVKDALFTDDKYCGGHPLNFEASVRCLGMNAMTMEANCCLAGDGCQRRRRPSASSTTVRCLGAVRQCSNLHANIADSDSQLLLLDMDALSIKDKGCGECPTMFETGCECLLASRTVTFCCK